MSRPTGASNASEGMIMEGYFKAYTENLALSIGFHLLNMLIEDPYERDLIIVEITEYFLIKTQPLLDSFGKDNILLKSKCINFIKDIAKDFLQTEEGKNRLINGSTNDTSIKEPAEPTEVKKDNVVSIIKKENEL